MASKMIEVSYSMSGADIEGRGLISYFGVSYVEPGMAGKISTPYGYLRSSPSRMTRTSR